ncbi:MAG: hypothetical protein ACREEB_18830 [Caulobacteraceae bacterium]
MLKVCLALALAMSCSAALAQQSPVSAPPAGEPDANPIPPLSSPNTTVTVQPDKSATPMADPQSAAIYGSPSAVETPSSPMPNPNAWPTPTGGMKRPNWVKKAPPAAKAAPVKKTLPPPPPSS